MRSFSPSTSEVYQLREQTEILRWTLRPIPQAINPSIHPWRWALVLGVLVVVVGSLLDLWINGDVDALVAIPGLFMIVGVGLSRSRGWHRRRPEVRPRVRDWIIAALAAAVLIGASQYLPTLDLPPYAAIAAFGAVIIAVWALLMLLYRGPLSGQRNNSRGQR
jgi:uncharacterized membrane protein HdeD (DUF308 family)